MTGIYHVWFVAQQSTAPFILVHSEMDELANVRGVFCRFAKLGTALCDLRQETLRISVLIAPETPETGHDWVVPWDGYLVASMNVKHGCPLHPRWNSAKVAEWERSLGIAPAIGVLNPLLLPLLCKSGGSGAGGNWRARSERSTICIPESDCGLFAY